MPMPRHGVAGAVIGNRFHLVSGMIQSAGAMAFLDPKLETHTASHDVLELQFNRSDDACGERAAPSTSTSAIVRRVPRRGAASADGPKKALHALQRQQPRRPGDAREIRAGDRDHADVAGLRSPFLDLVVEYPLDQGLPGVPVGLLQEAARRKSSRHSRRSIEPMPRPCGTAARPTPTTPPTPSSINSGTSCPGIDSCSISSRGSFARCCTMRSFTLPYWNPVTGNPDDLIVPAVFRDPGSHAVQRHALALGQWGRTDRYALQGLDHSGCPQREVVHRLADRQPWVQSQARPEPALLHPSRTRRRYGRIRHGRR